MVGQSNHLLRRYMTSSASTRISGIDIARGLAIYLMFQSHTVKGLLYFRDMPDWGIVPMHTLTKLSSSLFVLVFGVTLGLIFAPRTENDNWSVTRNHLWWKALVVILWYKVLTVVQTAQTRPPKVIVDMLLYKKFPDFVEILDFYGWMLLLIPLLLPLWRRLPFWVGPIFALSLAVLGQLLAAYWDFFSVDQFKAILVEDDKNFCFGLLTRGPLALFGLFIGDFLSRAQDFHLRRKQIAVAAIVLGVLLLVLFVALYHDNPYQVLYRIARNKGKHPPQLFFMFFSLGGSMVILGLALFLGGRAPLFLKPLEILGRESLTCFVWHILLIFLGLRWLFDLKRFGEPKVTYGQALLLTGVVTITAIAVASLNTWRKRWWSRRREEDLFAALPTEAPSPPQPQQEPPGQQQRQPQQPQQRPQQRQPEQQQQRPQQQQPQPPRQQLRQRRPSQAQPARRQPATASSRKPLDTGDTEQQQHDQIIKDLLK